ncbi:tetratricopeptide repeat protein 6 isoform X2 [Lissotriton helveticus]
MAARRNPLRFGQNHLEEERMRAQLERVQQQFQRDFIAINDLCVDAPSPPPQVEAPPLSHAIHLRPHLTDSSWAPEVPSEDANLATTEKAFEVLAKWLEGQEDSRGGENPASDGRPPSQGSLPLKREASSRTAAERKPRKGLGREKLQKEISPVCKREMKPAISSLLGTIKGVSVCSRPEPPAKPRSYRPPSPAQPPSRKPSGALQTKKPVPVAGRKVSHQGSKVKEKWQKIEESSSSASDSDESSSSGSERDTFQIRARKRRRVKSQMKDQVLPDPASEGQKQPRRRGSGLRSVPSASSVAGLSTMKLATEDAYQPLTRISHVQLTGPEEQPSSSRLSLQAQDSAGPGDLQTRSHHGELNGMAEWSSSHVQPLAVLDPAEEGPSHTLDSRVQLSGPEKPLSRPVLPARAKARSVDEIIASLRSPSQTPALSASDLMIRELMESILDQNQRTVMESQDLEKEQSLQVSENEVSVDALQQPGCRLPAEVPDESVNLTLDHAPGPLPVPGPATALGSVTDPIFEPAPEVVPITPMEPESSLPQVKVPAGSPASRLSESCIPVGRTTSQSTEDILKLPLQVTYTDILHVKGTAQTISKVPRASVSKCALGQSPPALLATWIPRDKESGHGTVHHFCTSAPSRVLPFSLQLASKVHHTIDRLRPVMQVETILQALQQDEWCFPDKPSTPDTSETSCLFHEGIPVSALLDTHGKDSVVVLPPRTEDSLEEWQRVAEYYVEGPRLELVGGKVGLYSESTKMFWTPAPPKFSTPLTAIKEVLFQKYESFLPVDIGNDEFLREVLEDEVSEEELDRTGNFLMSRPGRSASLPNLTLPETTSCRKKMKACLVRRWPSAPHVPASKELVSLPNDFQSSMKELKLLKEQLAEPEVLYDSEPSPVLPTQPEEKPGTSPPSEKKEEQQEQIQPLNPMPTTPSKVTLADEARKSGKKFVIYPPKKKGKRSKKGLNPEKLKEVHEHLRQPPRTITSSVSLQRLNIHASLRSAAFANRRHERKASLPLALDFNTFAEARGGIADLGEREWVRDLWNTWFDDVFPHSRPPSMAKEPEVQASKPSELEPVKAVPGVSLRLVSSVTPVLLDDTTATVQDVEAEVHRLTELIEQPGETSVFLFCRRGALYRRLGKLSKALKDLGRAIAMEPLLLDAYWQRHLIYRLQEQNANALDDLNFILKYNKNHADAYLSKAEICKSQGDITLAIINYSQALKIRPEDGDIYYSRAEMYERRGELILAMDDYAQSFLYNPQRTEAMMKHGLHQFENGNWNAAILDFTALLKQNHNDAHARMYRGRACMKQSRYAEAVEDFCAAIHLDPINWLTFYYRGCLLRKTHPQRALQDFSTSVLINDGFENLNSFLHRGILYTDLSLWDEAICDFESVLELDRTMAMAYVNIGLICLLHQDNYYKAIRQFSAAIQVDPTSTRAYLCRAQTYHKIHELPKALKDVTRAIHLQPDAIQMYIIRGLYLFEMKQYDLASFCIHYAAEMDQGTSPVQRALVQAFHQDYPKAIELLSVALKVQPTLSMFILLGKIQMKAKKAKDAVDSFMRALFLLHPPEKRPMLTRESAEIFYLLGLCYVEQVNLLKALDAFNTAIKADPGYTAAFYHRGVCRMRLNQSKAIQDFNRALAVNPKQFQVYLCRAAFYGFTKRYTKAIMNCNEAIKLEPSSVRAYLYRGALKYYAQVYKLAVEDLTKAAQMDPACSLAFYNRAVVHHETKAYEKALADYSTVLLLGPCKETDTKTLHNRGVLYLELKDYGNALQDFKEAMEKHPSDVRILLVLGLCHHRLRQFAEAVGVFDQVLKLDPLSADAYVGRGNSYMEYGHMQATYQAQRDFLRALHLSPKCLKARISLGYNLQLCLFRLTTPSCIS